MKDKGDHNFNIYDQDTEFSVTGFWVDRTKIVDDRLNTDFHKIGSFHISEITGVRLVENPSSKTTHNRLEFKVLVRG